MRYNIGSAFYALYSCNSDVFWGSFVDFSLKNDQDYDFSTRTNHKGLRDTKNTLSYELFLFYSDWKPACSMPRPLQPRNGHFYSGSLLSQSDRWRCKSFSCGLKNLIRCLCNNTGEFVAKKSSPIQGIRSTVSEKSKVPPLSQKHCNFFRNTAFNTKFGSNDLYMVDNKSEKKKFQKFHDRLENFAEKIIQKIWKIQKNLT